MGKLIDFDSMAHVSIDLSYYVYRILPKKKWGHRLTMIFKQVQI